MWNLVIVSIASVTRCAFFGTLPRPSTRPPQRQHSDYTAAGLPVPTSQHPGEGWARPGELLRSPGDGIDKRAWIATAMAAVIGGGRSPLAPPPSGHQRPDARPPAALISVPGISVRHVARALTRREATA